MLELLSLYLTSFELLQVYLKKVATDDLGMEWTKVFLFAYRKALYFMNLLDYFLNLTSFNLYIFKYNDTNLSYLIDQ